MVRSYQLGAHVTRVSMKSGLGDRNNQETLYLWEPSQIVSMKSGLGDRNNAEIVATVHDSVLLVSMKSGLRDRNNLHEAEAHWARQKLAGSQ